MSAEEIDAGAKTAFALLKAKYPASIENEDAVFFEIAFVAGANWATTHICEKFKAEAKQ